MASAETSVNQSTHSSLIVSRRQWRLLWQRLLIDVVHRHYPGSKKRVLVLGVHCWRLRDPGGGGHSLGVTAWWHEGVLLGEITEKCTAYIDANKHQADRTAHCTRKRCR